MRRFSALIIMVALLPTLLAGCLYSADQNSSNNVEVPMIDVDDFAADPTAYHGTIGIRGIVAATNRADASFVIIDVREYELCGVLTCAANEITISVPADKYSGELPRTEDIIIAYGEFSAGDSFGMIQVSRIERDNQVIIRQY